MKQLLILLLFPVIAMGQDTTNLGGVIPYGNKYMLDTSAQHVKIGTLPFDVNSLHFYNYEIRIAYGAKTAAYKDSTGWYIIDTARTAIIMLELSERYFEAVKKYRELLLK